MKLRARVWVLLGEDEVRKAILVTIGTKPTDSAPVHFPGWEEALGKESLSVVRRDLFRTAIVRFLRHCRRLHAPATVALIRSYLSGLDGSPVDREALLWFYPRKWLCQRGGRI